MQRLFVAAWPSPELIALIESIPRPSDAGVRWTRREQWHVTLRFLGAIEDDEVELVCDALSSVRIEPPIAVAGPAVAALGRRVLHVPVAGLDELAVAVTEATAGMGERPRLPFTGHITLARNKGNRSLQGLTGTPVAAHWPVDAFDLVRSRPSTAGAAYEVIRRFPLASP